MFQKNEVINYVHISCGGNNRELYTNYPAVLILFFVSSVQDVSPSAHRFSYPNRRCPIECVLAESRIQLVGLRSARL
jgi:hypothetical protein